VRASRSRRRARPAVAFLGGRAHLHGPATQIGEKRREPLGIGEIRRHDQLRRHRRCGAVVLETEGLEHGQPVLTFDVLQMEGVTVNQFAVTEWKHLHRRLLTVERKPNHVRGTHGPLVRRLPGRERVDRLQPVPIASRILVSLLGRSFLHFLLQRACDRAGVSTKKRDHRVDHFPVRLTRDRANARRRTAFDVEVETRRARVATWRWPLAGAKLEDAVEHIQRLAHLLRVRVRAEVHGAPPMSLTREHHPRVLV
jgi:hypothetical protein